MASQQQQQSQPQQQQPQQRPLDPSPISSVEAAKTSANSLESLLYAHIRDRALSGLHYIHIVQRLPKALKEKFEKDGFRVYNGEYASMVEWD